MKKISAVIIDDELNNCLNLQSIIQRYCDDIDVVSLAHSAVEGIDVISKFKPKLVFLDIKMPGGSGFDMLERIQNTDFEVIFVTAYDQYAIKAIRLSAIDYLLKPINILDLKSAVSRAVDKISKSPETNKSLENYLENINKSSIEKKIALPTAERIVFSKVSGIIRMEGENNYTHIFFENGEKLLVSRTIKEYEELLSENGFIRTHQSHLVNKNYVHSYEKHDGGYLKLQNGDTVNVSRQRKEYVLRLLRK